MYHRRFLRARNFDLAAAQKQLADTESWRRTNDVDNLYATFDPMEFEKAKRFYPRWTGRRDKVRTLKLAQHDDSEARDDVIGPRPSRSTCINV